MIWKLINWKKGWMPSVESLIGQENTAHYSFFFLTYINRKYLLHPILTFEIFFGCLKLSNIIAYILVKKWKKNSIFFYLFILLFFVNISKNATSTHSTSIHHKMSIHHKEKNSLSSSISFSPILPGLGASLQPDKKDEVLLITGEPWVVD